MKLSFLCLVFGLATAARASTGSLSGKIVDTDTHQPLVGADVMVLRHFNFKKTNFTTYLDLQNIFDRNNQWERVYLENEPIRYHTSINNCPWVKLLLNSKKIFLRTCVEKKKAHLNKHTCFGKCFFSKYRNLCFSVWITYWN